MFSKKKNLSNLFKRESIPQLIHVNKEFVIKLQVQISENAFSLEVEYIINRAVRHANRTGQIIIQLGDQGRSA